MATASSVEALAPGDHVCLAFSKPDERLIAVAASTRQGFEWSARTVGTRGEH